MKESKGNIMNYPNTTAEKLIEVIEEAKGQLDTIAANADPRSPGEAGRQMLTAQSFGTLLSALVMETHGLRLAQERANHITLGQAKGE